MQAQSLTGRQLDQTIQDFKATIAKIKDISSKFNYKAKERINRTALFEVEIKHTNEYTVSLGCEYYAEVRGEEAIQIMELKIKHYQEMKRKLQGFKQSQEEVLKVMDTDVISRAVKIGESKTGYVEMIGEENGESIFNIVEVEGEDQEPEKKEALKQEKTVQQISQSEPHKEESSIKGAQSKSKDLLVTEFSEKKQAQNNSQKEKEEDEEQFEQEDDGQNLDDFSSDDEEYDDIILNHRSKYGIFSGTQSQETSQPKTQPIVQPQQIVSKQSQKQQNLQTKPKQQKPKKKKQAEIPQKISRFKLEKMKERLEKQL